MFQQSNYNSKYLLVFIVLSLITGCLFLLPSAIALSSTFLQSMNLQIAQIQTTSTRIYHLFQHYPHELNCNSSSSCAISNYFGYGIVYDCSNTKNQGKIRITMLTIAIDFKDEISMDKYIINHKHYAMIHGYRYILIYKSLINKPYSHKQKPYIFYHVMNQTKRHHQYIDYLLIMDLDVFYLNCGIPMGYAINYTQTIDIYKNNKLNVIFSADVNGVNIGVLLFNYCSCSINFMKNLYLMLEDLENKWYQFQRPDFISQNAFSALIFGFDIYHKPNKSMQNDYVVDEDTTYNFDHKKGPKDNNDSVSKWYNRFLLNNMSRNNAAIIPQIYLNNIIDPMGFLRTPPQPLPINVHFAGRKKEFVLKFLKFSNCKECVVEQTYQSARTKNNSST
eukprot:241104_1